MFIQLEHLQIAAFFIWILLMLQLEEFEKRWNTCDFNCKYDENKNLIEFIFSTGGWEDRVYTWKIVKIPIY
jgi:hypothetical protein